MLREVNEVRAALGEPPLTGAAQTCRTGAAHDMAAAGSLWHVLAECGGRAEVVAAAPYDDLSRAWYGSPPHRDLIGAAEATATIGVAVVGGQVYAVVGLDEW